MPLAPPFSIGVFNLWICTALLFLLPGLISVLTATGWKRALTLPETSGHERWIVFTWLGLQPLLYIYTVFVPFAPGRIWFYPGLVIFVAGLIMGGFAAHAYQSTPRDVLVTKGVYRLSRNPDYFGAFVAYLGMGLLGAAWPILVLSLGHFVFYQKAVNYEERMCAVLWPREFAEYRSKVAKNFLFF